MTLFGNLLLDREETLYRKPSVTARYGFIPPGVTPQYLRKTFVK